MRETKTGRISASITPSDKEEFEAVAFELGVTAAGLAATLLEGYLAHRKKYGNQVFYPPKFHTFESIKIQEEADRSR